MTSLFMWHDFFAALALVLVIEGILPFLKPTSWRRMISVMAGQPDQSLRVFGLSCMLIGVGLLYVVR